MSKSQRHFYSHLIPMDEILIELHTMGISANEKTHLLAIIESNMHYTILNVVLNDLSEDEKQIFVEKLQESNHNVIWKFLHQKTQNIEIKIKQASEQLKNELIQDMKEAKQKH